jgi:hypothetical protein
MVCKDIFYPGRLRYIGPDKFNCTLYVVRPVLLDTHQERNILLEHSVLEKS